MKNNEIHSKVIGAFLLGTVMGAIIIVAIMTALPSQPIEESWQCIEWKDTIYYDCSCLHICGKCVEKETIRVCILEGRNLIRDCRYSKCNPIVINEECCPLIYKETRIVN